MAVTGNRKAAGKALNDLPRRSTPESAGGVQPWVLEGRMMTVAERVAFADDIRSRSRPTKEDSTDLIRRDRDER